MAQGEVNFLYLKEDGSVRPALGNTGKAPVRQGPATTRKVSPLVLTYFDLLVNDWRSCRIDRLILI